MWAEWRTVDFITAKLEAHLSFETPELFLPIDTAEHHRTLLNLLQHRVERHRISRNSESYNIKADYVDSNHIALWMLVYVNWAQQFLCFMLPYRKIIFGKHCLLVQLEAFWHGGIFVLLFLQCYGVLVCLFLPVCLSVLMTENYPPLSFDHFVQFIVTRTFSLFPFDQIRSEYQRKEKLIEFSLAFTISCKCRVVYRRSFFHSF